MATAFKTPKDNAEANLLNSGDLNNTTSPITVSVVPGEEADFATPGNGVYVTLYDNVSYSNPEADSNMEKAIVTAIDEVAHTVTLQRDNPVAHPGAVIIECLHRSQALEDIHTAINTTENNIDLKADKIVAGTDGNLVAQDSTGNITDAGASINDFVEQFSTINSDLGTHTHDGVTSGGTVDHTTLSNIGTNTHADIDTALTRLANTSGTNTGDQTNIDTVDTYHANATPTANCIPVLGSDTNLPDGVVDTTSIEDDAVTPAKIPNRTRRVVASVDGMSSTDVVGSPQWRDAQSDFINLRAVIPMDYAGGNVTFNILRRLPGASGTAVMTRTGFRFRNNADYDTVVTSGDCSITADANTDRSKVLSITIPSTNIQAGDIIRIDVVRLGNNGGDTFLPVVTYDGAYLEYTADS